MTLPTTGTGEVVTYFVQAAHGGPIKIGKSCRNILAARVASLQTGNPNPLVVRRTMRGNHEPDYHHQFREHRLCGEWFEPTRELRKIARATLGRAGSDPIRDAYLAGFRDGVNEEASHAADELDIALRVLDRLRRDLVGLPPSEGDVDLLVNRDGRVGFDRYVAASRDISAHAPTHTEPNAA